MTNRLCKKCGDSLVPNAKLGLMECVSGKHIEPINLVRAQWWNQCPKCKQMGLNDADGEHYLQALDEKKQPITKEVGDKKHVIVFNENSAQKPITCKACGHEFVKKGALN